MYRILLCILLGVLITACAFEKPLKKEVRITDPAAVVNRTWQWHATVTPDAKTSVDQPERYTILLTGDGKMQAKFDCNKGGGDYRISDGKLSFGPLLSTRMACPPDTQDARFMQDLQRVQTFFIEKDTLYLEFAADSTTMQFREIKNLND